MAGTLLAGCFDDAAEYERVYGDNAEILSYCAVQSDGRLYIDVREFRFGRERRLVEGTFDREAADVVFRHISGQLYDLSDAHLDLSVDKLCNDESDAMPPDWVHIIPE